MGDLVIMWIGGNCPVQAEGTVGGKPFYFRARGDEWSFSVWRDDTDKEANYFAPAYYHEEEYGEGPFDAGWMPEDEARAFIEREAAKVPDILEARDAS